MELSIRRVLKKKLNKTGIYKIARHANVYSNNNLHGTLDKLFFSFSFAIEIDDRLTRETCLLQTINQNVGSGTGIVSEKLFFGFFIFFIFFFY